MTSIIWGWVQIYSWFADLKKLTSDLVDELCDADDVVVGAVEDGDAEHAARLEAVRLRERPLHPQPLRHAAHVQDLQPGRKSFSYV